MGCASTLIGRRSFESQFWHFPQLHRLSACDGASLGVPRCSWRCSVVTAAVVAVLCCDGRGHRHMAVGAAGPGVGVVSLGAGAGADLAADGSAGAILTVTT